MLFEAGLTEIVTHASVWVPIIYFLNLEESELEVLVHWLALLRLHREFPSEFKALQKYVSDTELIDQMIRDRELTSGQS